MDLFTWSTVIGATVGGLSLIGSVGVAIRGRRLARPLRFVFTILLPSLVMLGAIGEAIWVGVKRSSETGHAAAGDLVHARAFRSDTATAFLVGRATERATYATAQATQGLVWVTVGVVAATLLAAISIGAERVAERNTDRSVRQSTELYVEKIVLGADVVEGTVETSADGLVIRVVPAQRAEGDRKASAGKPAGRPLRDRVIAGWRAFSN